MPIQELFELAMNSFQTREGIIAILISICLTFVYRLNIIYDFWDKFSKREITYLQELLKENSLTGKTQEIVQESLNSKAFRYVTKINAEKYLREKIIELHELANGRLTYANFRNAYSFLLIDKNGDLKIRKIRKFGFEKIYWVFHTVLSYIFWLICCFLFILLMLIPSDETRLRLIILVLIALFFGLAIFSVQQTFPLSSAEKIKEEIETIRTRQ